MYNGKDFHYSNQVRSTILVHPIHLHITINLLGSDSFSFHLHGSRDSASPGFEIALY